MALIKVLAFISALSLFFDNIDILFDEKRSVDYKVVRTIIIVFLMIYTLYVYFKI